MKATDFVEDLNTRNQLVLSRLGEFETLALKDEKNVKQADLVKLLKIALKNEMESCELASAWLPNTVEVDVKLALARQAGDEASHYSLIEERLGELGADLTDFQPLKDGHNKLFQFLLTLNDTVERVAAGQFTLEAIALVKNEQFIKLCERLGDDKTADLYRKAIQVDEKRHHDVGRQILERYATTPESQEKASAAAQKTLLLAEELQGLAHKKLGVVCGPGC